MIARALTLAGSMLVTFAATSGAQDSNCTAAERRAVLRSMQAEVLKVAPRRLDSLEKAIQPGGVLAQWILSPDATVEPPRPKLDVGIVVWHPQYWDLHVWMGGDGTPTVSFANPKATGAGLSLPDEVNYRLVNGRRVPVFR